MSALIGPSNEEPLPRPPRQRGGKLRPPVDGVTTGGSIIRQSNVTAPRSRKSRGVWLFPSGAILTGLIVALVLSPAEPLYAVVGTAALAIASKHVFRTRWSNIFNPAAFGLVLAVFLFGSGESWWGSLAELPVP